MRAPSWAPLVPLLAVVALLAVPAGGGEATASAADLASAVLVVFCLVRLVRARARPLDRAAALVLGLPVLGVCVAAVTAHDPAGALPGVVRYLQVFVLVPAAVVLLVRDRKDFALVAWALIGLALVEGAVGAVQYLTGTGASYMGEDIRAVGTFSPAEVMGMATIVSYGLLSAVGIALATAVRRERVAALVCAGLLVMPLVVSFSRGAWIATLAGCAAQLVLSGPRRAVRVGLAAGALGVVLVAGFGIGSQLLQERVASISRVTAAPDRSVTDRYTMWAAAGAMWRTEPVTGVGLKAFPHHRDSHASLALSSGSDTAGAGHGFRRQPLLSPHNMYLLVLSEQGLLGLLALAGGWLALLVRALVRLRAAHRPARGRGPAEAAAAGCGLIATGLLVRQLVDFSYADIGGPPTVLTAVVLGLTAWWALAPANASPGAPGAEGAAANASPGARGAGEAAASASPGARGGAEKKADATPRACLPTERAGAPAGADRAVVRG
ncbi:O-antigen ligase family protein [Streptomyces sp. NRRL S-118]|uniref:O-antigen ligase family protein n=1 Tax=Streptomyces sp. NRRL S-118 TaxID=1463881 RepID=UPI00099B862F|nr:O-antigen ligase family protein [Streptomyces sp. NRRL S-118]